MKSKSIAAGAIATALWAGVPLAAHGDVPSFIVPDSVQVIQYDGIIDDLLSAGLNQAGLESSTPPGFVDPLNPTDAELRRRAIWTNYRAVIDAIRDGGMGLLWGPQSPGAPVFAPPVVPGLIPGAEYKAFLDTIKSGGNINHVPVMAQIPDNFDTSKPCIVVASPSGSRGYYGGIAVGEWGLFEGCAVAYPGKGTGTGFHLLGPDSVYDLNGQNIAANSGHDAQFQVKDSKKLANFVAAYPDRVATKHAHSQLNPERMWGNFALKSIRFALWALNHHFIGQNVPEFTKKNTIVIASGVSNGAGTSVRALEKDTSGLIDGLVVTEPSLNPRSGGKFVINFGDETFADHGRTLYDNITMMGTYAGCAALDSSLAGTPFFGAQPIGAPAGALQNRCAGLRQLGLLTTDTLEEQAAESLAMLRTIGYYEDEDWGIASHEWLNLWRSLQPTYAAAQGKFPVSQNICDVSFAATDANGSPIPVPDTTAAILFSTSGGIPATSGIDLIADDAVNGPILEQQAISKRTGLQDLNLDGALCFRFLSTGDFQLLGRPEGGEDWLMHEQVHEGGRYLQTNGFLRHIPSIIIHGREDALVFPNSHSRAYFGLNQLAESGKSRLSYWEITPAQHFDALISSFWRVPAFTGPVEFVPLHYYLTEGLDKMMAHLTNGDSLPPSQVVRATARGLVPYTPANVSTLLPLPEDDPEPEDRITFANGAVNIPE